MREFAWALVVLLLALAACAAAWPERRAKPLMRWRLIVVPLLIGAATLVVLYLPPFMDLAELAVWTLVLISVLGGAARGAWIKLKVDHRRRLLVLQRAREGFWLAVLVVVLVLVSIAVRPFGRLDSPFIQALEVVLGVVWGFLVGRNGALLVRSRDAPQHDL
ncbi:MAG: hypothetical protein ISP45_16340 [Reyranella sp.]|nr:hypothetical protein [Reyranella sp.]